MKAWGGHTSDNFSLRTDVSYSFFARRKVTSAVSIPQRLKGRKFSLVSVGRMFRFSLLYSL